MTVTELDYSLKSLAKEKKRQDGAESEPCIMKLGKSFTTPVGYVETKQAESSTKTMTDYEAAILKNPDATNAKPFAEIFAEQKVEQLQRQLEYNAAINRQQAQAEPSTKTEGSKTMNEYDKGYQAATARIQEDKLRELERRQSNRKVLTWLSIYLLGVFLTFGHAWDAYTYPNQNDRAFDSIVISVLWPAYWAGKLSIAANRAMQGVNSK